LEQDLGKQTVALKRFIDGSKHEEVGAKMGFMDDTTEWSVDIRLYFVNFISTTSQ
jgi:hypothetical protein